MEKENRKNLKGEKFEKFLKEKEIKFFSVEEGTDANNTKIFRSFIETEGQRLPTVIITDNTLYSIIRVQLIPSVVKDDNKAEILEYLNKVNRSYKVFKYVVSEDGSIFLDACIPCTEDGFDAEVIWVILEVIVDHLQEEFKKVMKEIWD